MVTLVYSEFNEFYTCLVCLIINQKETPPSDCDIRSVVRFLTIENNSAAEIHQCLWVTYSEENVINFKNIQ